MQIYEGTALPKECSYQFRLGEEYLVYAYGPADKMQVVAALKSAPNTLLRDDAKNCFSNLAIKADPSLVAVALKAIERIKTNSELRELWDESETPDDWYQAVINLEERLRR